MVYQLETGLNVKAFTTAYVQALIRVNALRGPACTGRHYDD